MNCPACGTQLDDGFLYARGLGAALHWSTERSTSLFSRRDLEQIDLRRASVRPTGAQAVLPAMRCNGCSRVIFETA